MKKPHFIALLNFLPAENGGLKIPVMSGYRPSLKFPFGKEVTGIQNFIDAENAFPGDSIKAEITLSDPDRFKGQLYKGLDFDFFEGQNPIGHGVIMEVFADA